MKAFITKLPRLEGEQIFFEYFDVLNQSWKMKIFPAGIEQRAEIAFVQHDNFRYKS